MRTLHCIIADDEPVARKILQEFIGQVPFLELAGQFETALKAQNYLRDHPADILFLDIEMPKLNGRDYLKNYRVQPLVILTTAYPEYALEGYELDIIDYLLKPISFARFLKAVQKVQDYINLREGPGGLDDSAYLFVRSEKRIEKIGIEDILYIESTGNYVNIITSSKKILAYLTLKGVENQLAPGKFIKVHQSFLVNFSGIEAVEGNQVRVRDKWVPVSRGYRDSLMQMIDKRLLKR